LIHDPQQIGEQILRNKPGHNRRIRPLPVIGRLIWLVLDVDQRQSSKQA
jgi:hypothetical protein